MRKDIRDQSLEHFKNQVESDIVKQVGSKVRYPLVIHLEIPIWSQVGDQSRNKVWDQTCDYLIELKEERKGKKQMSKSKVTSEKLIQGDVILRRVGQLPEEGVNLLPTKILQQSEITGHHHYFLPKSPVRLYEMATTQSREGKGITPDTGKFIVVDEETVLYHGIPSKKGEPIPGSNDHLPVKLPAGIYKVTIAREWDYDAEEIATVVD